MTKRSWRPWRTRALPAACLAAICAAGSGAISRAQAPVPGAAAALQPQMLTVKTSGFQLYAQPIAAFREIDGRTVTIDGLPFAIHGEKILGGQYAKDRLGGNRLTQFTVPVGRVFDELHLLHFAKFSADPAGALIAVVRLNYIDRSIHDFRIAYGVHVLDLIRTPFEPAENLADPGSKVIFRGPGLPEVPGSSARLCASVLLNPHPDKPVVSIGFITAQGQSCYGLVAATVAQRDPGRPVTAPVPAADGPVLGGRLRLLVTDRATGRPVAGATVLFSPDIAYTWAAALPTSAEGEAVFPYPSGAANSLTVAASGAGYVRGQLRGVKLSAAGLTLALDPAAAPAPLPGSAEESRYVVPQKKFLEIADGASLASVRAALGVAARHEFTVVTADGDYTLVTCLVRGEKDKFPGEGDYPFALLFRGQYLQKISELPRRAVEKIPDQGRTVTRVKSWDIDDTDYIAKVIRTRPIGRRQILADLAPYTGGGEDPLPAVIFVPLLAALAAESAVLEPARQVQNAIREDQLRRFDGYRAERGMTAAQVDSLYGAPLRIVPLKEQRTARLYGDTRELALADEEDDSGQVAVIFDPQGRTAAIYSDDFFNPDWVKAPAAAPAP